MPEITVQATIEKPLFDVFKQAADYEGMYQWHSDVSNIQLIAAKPLRAGSMLTMNRRQLGSPIFVNADFVDVDRNKALEMTGMWGRFPFRRRIEFSAQARTTSIKDHVTIKTGFIFFWYAPILSASIRRQLQAEWNALAAFMQAG